MARKLPTAPNPEKEELVKIASELRRASFEGEVQQFDDTIEKYKQRFFEMDPHARLLLEEACRYTSHFSFRSTTMDLQYNRQQRDLRIQMWFKHVPLDLQFSIMMLDGLGRDFQDFPLGEVSFDQLSQVLDSQDHLEAFLSSPLCDPHYIKNKVAVPRHFEKRISGLHRDIRQLAWECLNHGMFETFDELMDTARINPWDAVGSFMLHHRTQSSRGYSRVEFKRSAPFWAVGMFFPSCDQRYWDVIKKHGGPAVPVVNNSLARPTNKARLWKKPVASPPQTWSNPMDWLTTKSAKEITNRSEVKGYIDEVIATNMAFWKAISLSSGITLPPSVSSKPKM